MSKDNHSSLNGCVVYLGDYPDYIDILAEWRSGEWQQYLPYLTVEYSKKSLISHCNYNKLPIAYAYVIDSKPVGLVCIREYDLDINREYKPWLGSLLVSTEYRNKGIGGELINSVKKKVALMGYSSLYIYLFNHSLEDWYVKHGFKFVEYNYQNGNQVIVMKIELNKRSLQ
jgi:GNAT superfamily N-acetyltransferase